MKKTLLFSGLLFSLMLWASFSFAQCTPNSAITDPDGTGRMDPDTLYATELQPMNTTITIICPTHGDVGGGSITVHHITLKSIVNEPSWMVHSCPSNCEFMAGALSCALVTGTPTIGSAGTVYMQVVVDVYATLFGNPVLVQPDYNSGDTLVLIILPAGSGIVENSQASFEVIQNQPNPFNMETVIGLNANTSDIATLKVFDILGNMIYTEQKAVVPGENYFNFNGRELSNGVYFYSVMDEQNNIITRKMIKGY